MRMVARCDVSLRIATRPLRRLAFLRRRKVDTGAPRFRQADRDGLLGRTSAVLSLADVIHFLVDEFAGLCARRLAFSLVAPGAFDGLSFGHREPQLRMCVFCNSEQGAYPCQGLSVIPSRRACPGLDPGQGISLRPS